MLDEPPPHRAAFDRSLGCLHGRRNRDCRPGGPLAVFARRRGSEPRSSDVTINTEVIHGKLVVDQFRVNGIYTALVPPGGGYIYLDGAGGWPQAKRAYAHTARFCATDYPPKLRLIPHSKHGIVATDIVEQGTVSGTAKHESTKIGHVIIGYVAGTSCSASWR